MKSNLLGTSLFLCIYKLSLCAGIEIKPIQPDQIGKAIELYFDIVHEFQLIPCTNKQDAVDFFYNTHQDKDYDLEAYCFDNRGTFLVVTNNQKIIGTGAIKFLDDESCELKRFYLAKEFRRKGLGTKLLRKLISYAQSFNYKKMRLEIYFPVQQHAAISLYRTCGFYEIPPYRESQAQLQMEMKL